MIDALAKALELAETAEGADKWESEQAIAAVAASYAAIAAAQAQERQAAALERIADALDIMAHPNRIVAPDPQDYYSEADYLKAAEKHDYNKHSRPGESILEYQARWEAEHSY